MLKNNGIPRGIRTALITLTWFPVLYTFTSHVYLPYRITGFSMTPTFNPGLESTANDIVLVQKFNLKKPDSFKRGDIVVFRSPEDPEKVVTKRVTGLQGEIINTKSPPSLRPQVNVPRNHLWLEGDNTFHSIDLNNFGPVSQGLVLGKVVGVIWPISRMGTDISKGGRDARKSDDIEFMPKQIEELE